MKVSFSIDGSLSMRVRRCWARALGGISSACGCNASGTVFSVCIILADCLLAVQIKVVE